MKPELQRTFPSAMQFYHHDFEELRFLVQTAEADLPYVRRYFRGLLAG